MSVASLALGLAVAALLIGPVLLRGAQRSRQLCAALDSLTLTLVLGLCLLYLGPHALAHGGLVALVGICAGVGLPVLLQRLERSTLWVGAALLTLAVHAFIDGVAMGMLDAEIILGISAAVIAHRLPVGLAISLRATSPRRATEILLGLAVLTVVGFMAGAGLGAALPEALHALLEGLIAGGLLHVVVAHRISTPKPVTLPIPPAVDSTPSVPLVLFIGGRSGHQRTHGQHANTLQVHGQHAHDLRIHGQQAIGLQAQLQPYLQDVPLQLQQVREQPAHHAHEHAHGGCSHTRDDHAHEHGHKRDSLAHEHLHVGCSHAQDDHAHEHLHGGCSHAQDDHAHEHLHGGCSHAQDDHAHEHLHGGCSHAQDDHAHEHLHGGCSHAQDDHAHEHQHGDCSHLHRHPDERHASAAGALLGVAGLAALSLAAIGTPALEHLQATSRAFFSLTLTSAPALVAGFVLAGLLSAFLDPARTSWLTGSGRPASQALRGVGFGLPLPVCSCGVVPMYQSLIQRGAPVTAALAFLVATPELGLDAVLLSVPLLGMPLTIARVLAAFAVAVAVALVVGRGVSSHPLEGDAPVLKERTTTERLRDGLRYGLVDLVDHTLPWILAGLLLAALAEPLMDHTFLASLPPALQVPIAALVGVPLYVCASGATPLAAVAIHKGLSTGAALTFLLAGPATNVTTFGVLSALHGRRVALRFGVALTVTAIFVGWGVDLIGVSVPDLGHPGDTHAHGTGLLGSLSALALLVIGSASVWRQGVRGMTEQILNPVHAH